jgi:predicted acetyltransferase
LSEAVKPKEEDIRIESDDIRLVYPAPCYVPDVREFLKECLNAGEKHIQGGGNMEHFALSDWLKRIRLERTLPATETTSPQETFLCYRVFDGALVGCCQLRHSLTEKTRYCGGNVGYEVRPALRGKGYGTLIFEAVLKHAREIGLKNLRADVDEKNESSVHVIEKCGGKYVKTNLIGTGKYVQNVRQYTFEL